jgi:hypothetical protein
MIGEATAMMQPRRYVRIFADEHGESHFADVGVNLEPVDFAPPASPLLVAALFPAKSCSYVRGSPEWDGSIPHPTPYRQVMCNLRGAYDVTTSDGTVRHFPAGRVLLLEDTTGKGHSTRVVSDDDMLIVSVTLAD